ncbi:MAG: UDP-glucose 4-epimerase GalE, partial [Nitrospinota bacterium]|nr:UDP-glucose 4-epimerase GalE [Nitrospinota bacterium]
MNILVVGGAGYIGSLMTRRLKDVGHTPIVLDDLSTGNRASVHDSITFYHGDLGDENILKRIFNKEKIELVMHFAAKLSVPESLAQPDNYYRNNVAKPLVLLDVMRKHGCNLFIFSSSSATYGIPKYLPIDEKHPTDSISPYGLSKRMLELILKDYHSAFGLRSVSLRYFNAAGAAIDGSMGESQRVKQNLIQIALDNLKNGRETIVYGTDYETRDGTCIRDYIHIEDIVEAHIKAIDHINKGNGFDIFNLGTERGTTVKEILDMISKVSSSEMKIKYAGRRP